MSDPSGRNSGSFGSVTLEFTRLDCVQQLLVNTRICFATIARWVASLLGQAGYTLKFVMHF